MNQHRAVQLAGANGRFSLPYSHKMLRRLARVEPDFAVQYSAFIQGEMDTPVQFAQMILLIEDLLEADAD